MKSQSKSTIQKRTRFISLFMAFQILLTSHIGAQANGFTQAVGNVFRSSWERAPWVRNSAKSAAALGLRSATDVLAIKTTGLIEDLAVRVGRADHVRTVDVNGYIQKIVANLTKQSQEFTIVVGEKGVGKTQYIFGAQERINLSQVPGAIEGARILRINPTHKLLDNPEMLERLVREMESQLSSQKGPVVLYFDNIERFVIDEKGTGELLDIIERFKKTIGQNHQIKVVLEASEKEFETLAKGSRRFEGIIPVVIKRMSQEHSIRVLRAVLPKLTNGKIKDLPESVLKKAAEYAEKYYSDTGLPNSAISLLDETFSWRQVFIKDRTMPLITDLENALDTLKSQKAEVDQLNGTYALELRQTFADEIKNIEIQIKDLKDNFNDVFGLQNHLDELYKAIQGLPEGKIPYEIANEIKELSNRLYAIDERDLAMTIHQTQGVPLSQLFDKARRRSLMEIISEIKMYIKGQDHVVLKVAEGIRQLESPNRVSKKPLSYLLLGWTGTGKTEIWKTVSRTKHDLFELRYDGSEFKEGHAISKWIGSPPGYEGHKEGGQLVVQVIRKKRANILVDEFDKVHENMRKLVYQVLDEGKLADGLDNIAEFQDCILIFTANWGERTLKPNASRAEILEELVKEGIEPALINRFTEVLVMNPLSKKVLGEILYKFIHLENIELMKSFNRISITPAAYHEIIARLDGGLNSGRDMERLFNELVKKPFYEALDNGYYHTGLISNSGKLRVRTFSIGKGDDVIVDFNSVEGFTLRNRVPGEALPQIQ